MGKRDLKLHVQLKFGISPRKVTVRASYRNASTVQGTARIRTKSAVAPSISGRVDQYPPSSASHVWGPFSFFFLMVMAIPNGGHSDVDADMMRQRVRQLEDQADKEQTHDRISQAEQLQSLQVPHCLPRTEGEGCPEWSVLPPTQSTSTLPSYPPCLQIQKK